MDSILIVGIIIVSGFILGEFVCRLGLPKITGYMAAGILLNPGLTGFIPQTFVAHTKPVTNMALAFIGFSIGGTVLLDKIRSLGKQIVCITLCEAEIAFVSIVVAFSLLGPWLMSRPEATLLGFFLPLALLLGSLAAPTDPSATLAVKHEYQAQGPVTTTVMSIAAFDDILGIINYSLGVSLAAIFVNGGSFNGQALFEPVLVIAGSIGLGIGFGWLLNRMTRLIENKTEGTFIVLVLGLLALCFGLAEMAGLEALLSAMVMGIVVTNYNHKSPLIFQILERYTEELIFVLFFTISVMHLDFTVLLTYSPLIFLFVLVRAGGKIFGTFVGATVSGAEANIRKYTAGGLLPQGGIVIGLALVMQHNQALGDIAPIVINVIIGTTIIHELSGPVVAKAFLKKAGELS